ncbi:MAG TPA: methionine/alanine import family NSS transporter small subunit [Microbacterium sp.]|nr:methionine/alanine import family NSS transporter small subunit [Microbacterium sp.]
MTGIAITFLVLSIVLVWGGLVASSIFLARRPDRADYPPGGIEDHREDAGVIEHDT